MTGVFDSPRGVRLNSKQLACLLAVIVADVLSPSNLAMATDAAGVKVLREQAETAEKSGWPDACARYFNLAAAEADIQLVAPAVNDARHGLKLYRKRDDSVGYAVGMLCSYDDV